MSYSVGLTYNDNRMTFCGGPINLYASDNTVSTLQFSNAGVIGKRRPYWQSHYESCYYLISFDSNLKPETANIGVIIQSSANTLVYVF